MSTCNLCCVRSLHRHNRRVCSLRGGCVLWLLVTAKYDGYIRCVSERSALSVSSVFPQPCPVGTL